MKLTKAGARHSHNLYYAPACEVALRDGNHVFTRDETTEVEGDPMWEIVPAGEYRSGMAVPRTGFPCHRQRRGLV